MPPHSARSWLVAFRHFVRWSETRKLIRNDPTWGIRIRAPNAASVHPLPCMAGALQCWGLATPEHIRKKWWPNSASE
jgi:hypothetical protein